LAFLPRNLAAAVRQQAFYFAYEGRNNTSEYDFINAVNLATLKHHTNGTSYFRLFLFD
jgi:hypothetical protein